MTPEEVAQQVLYAWYYDEESKLDDLITAKISEAEARGRAKALEEVAQECRSLEKYLPPEHDRTDFGRGRAGGISDCAKAIRALQDKVR